MDIKIITRHAPSNYGSLLQTIATQKILQKLGHRPTIIDYWRKDEQGFLGTLTLARQKDVAKNKIKLLLYLMVRYPMEKYGSNKFLAMRKRLLTMTRRISSKSELSGLTADVFMTGSDQVWGPLGNGRHDTAYFLDFVEGVRKIAYASSFGMTAFDDAVTNEYKRLLKNYDAIALREASGVEMLGKWGVGNRGQVLDPTLLIDGNEWAEVASDRKMPEKYILVYQIHNDRKLNRYAVDFARKAGLPLYRVSPWLHQIGRGGKFIYLPDVTEFLWLVKNCRYMITDSFHGTCFAINFNRQFVEILPNTNTGTRNQSILNLTHLEDRIVSDMNDFSLMDKEIDYERVNGILASQREQSIRVLEKMISEK